MTTLKINIGGYYILKFKSSNLISLNNALKVPTHKSLGVPITFFSNKALKIGLYLIPFLWRYLLFDLFIINFIIYLYSILKIPMSFWLPPSSAETLDRCRDIFETKHLSTSILMPGVPKTHQGLMIHFDQERDISNMHQNDPLETEVHFKNENLFQLVKDFQIVDYVNAIVDASNNWDVTNIDSCDPPHNDVLEPEEVDGVVTRLSKKPNQKRILPTFYQFREDVIKIVSETDWLEICPEIESQEKIAAAFEREFGYSTDEVEKSDCSKENIDRALKYFSNPKSDFSFLSKDMSLFRKNIATFIPSFSQHIYDRIPPERKYAKDWTQENRNVIMHRGDILNSLLHSRSWSKQWKRRNILTGAFITQQKDN